MTAMIAGSTHRRKKLSHRPAFVAIRIIGAPPMTSRHRSITPRQRLDQLLVGQGLAESRNQAQRLVMAGQVRIDGQLALKPSQLVEPTARLEVAAGRRYVSRGGEKLEAALAGFSLSVDGAVCADVGASTGGFTDCLLQNGAARVYAIDVGRGILHWKLRQDGRVVLMEGVNARHLSALPEAVSLVVIDAAFISLRHLLPVVVGWLSTDGKVVALVKPQFEAGKAAVGRKGVVRDPETHRTVLEEVIRAAREAGLAPQAVLPSPLLGPKGNVEFLLLCQKGASETAISLDSIVRPEPSAAAPGTGTD